MTEPPVLLLDEPLGALDLKLRKAMQLELKSLQRRLGLTVIHVTHDQEEALAVSDRLAVMYAGRVLQIGTPEAIYERPKSRFVADFIEAVYLGTDTRYTVRLGDRLRVTVRRQNHTGERLARGEPVYLSWSALSSHLLPSEA